MKARNIGAVAMVLALSLSSCIQVGEFPDPPKKDAFEPAVKDILELLDDDDCTAVCADRECGDDGCGGSCWSGPNAEECWGYACNQETGQCVCPYEKCDDGCCPAGQVCALEDGDSVCCAITCTGKECGDDGCGGNCGECDDGTFCNGLETCDADGQCQQGALEKLDDNKQCTVDECNEDEQQVTHTADDSLCDQSNPCEVGTCDLEALYPDGLGCTYEDAPDGPNDGCDDQNACTLDQCDKGECTSTLLGNEELEELELTVEDCLCKKDKDCEVLDEYDGDYCNGTLYCEKESEEDEFGLCKVDPKTVFAGDDIWCDGTDTCDPATGDVTVGEVPKTDDGLECTIDSCDEDNDKPEHTPDNSACDDSNPCTDDLCAPDSDDKDEETGCVNTAVADGPCPDCDDGNTCTLNHRCEGGLPLSDAFDCSDGNDCTADSCNDVDGAATCDNSNADDNTLCSDGIDCTTADHCESGVCIATPDNSLCVAENACSAGTCDLEQGCLYEGIVCDDLIPCTNDSCDDELGCQYVADNANCDDLIDCTLNQCLPESEAKDADGCVFEPDNALCDDTFDCTENICEAGVGCVFNPVHETCADVFACTTEDLCNPEADNKDAQGCAYTIDNIACNDTIGCTVDVCVVGIGCTNTPDNLACDDTFDCTENDICVEGQGCVYAPNDSLCPTDNIDCTDELCIVGQGCVSTPDHTKCDDTFDCTSNDTCDAVLGCVYTPDNSLCPDADGLACTLEECQEGSGCVAVPTDEECDDANTCTDDSCDPADGCLFIPNEAACDDSNACTEADTCVAGICEGGGLLDCDDDNFCTDDACDALLGCIQLENALECDDGNACTAADICQNGECQGEVLVCDDGNSCTVDSCDPVTGCAFDPVGSDDVVVDDFERPDNPDVGNDWVTHTGTWTISDGELKMTGGGGSAFATISKDIGYRETFDFRIRFRRVSGEPMFCVNGNGGPYNHDAHYDGGLCAFWNLEANGMLHLLTGDGEPWNKLAKTPMNLDIGVDYYVRITFDGSLLAAKLWKVSESEPAEPQVTVQTTNVALENNTEVVLSSDHPTEMYFAEVIEILGADCDDGNPCTTGDQCSAGKCVPGLPSPECGDFDHDGLMVGDDPCPYAYDPQDLDLDGDGESDACELLPNGFQWDREIVLSQEGSASIWRRTNEPVEIPLANGILDDSVVGYWKLDGGVATDYSGNGFHGTPEGAESTEGAFSDSAGALYLDGQAAKVTISHDVSLAPNRLTYMGWVNIDSLPNTTAVINKSGTGQTDGTSLILTSEGKLYLHWEISNTDYGVISESGISLNKWQHVAATYDGSTAAVYINGKLDNTAVATVDPPLTSDSVTFGQNQGQYMVGSLDELLVFRRALSPDEIATYYVSKAPYSTPYAYSAQADFDDVRVVETPSDAEGGAPYVTRSRIIGPRPHSDTPCPMNEDDGSWTDREDLCGVVGYWKLDGDGKDVTGNHDGVPTVSESTTGRFGDQEGAFHYKLFNDVVLVEDSPDFELETGTVEMWLKPDACPGNNPVHAFVKNAGGVHNDIMITLEQDCRFKVFQDNDLSLYSQAITQTGVWRHLAFTWDGKTEVLYLDGVAHASTAIGIKVHSPGNSIAIGAYKDGGDPVTDSFPGAIDDVLLHNVAKSPDYIYNRANPGVPNVRFLANTVVENQGTDENPSYPLRGYSLHWGNADATAELPFVGSQQQDGDPCYGLLNGCLGYAGWWRFNEGRGSTAVDSSINRGHGTIPGTSVWTNGLDGVALAGAGSPVTVPYKDSYDPTLLTLEGSFRLDNLTEVVYPLRKSEAYDLLVYEGEPRAYANVGGAHTYTYGDNVEQGAWLQLATQYDGSSVVLLQNTSVLSQEEVSGELANGSQELWLGLNSVGAGSFFSGALDDVRLMNRALSPDEMLHYPLLDWTLEQSSSLAKTITYSGDDQPFVVPDGVTQLAVKLWGAGGGSHNTADGGGGGFASGTLAVTPGETLTIIVGQGGVNGGSAYGGGGASEDEGNPARGGGGRTAIRRASDELATAGGGGGAGNMQSGGAGGGETGQQAGPGSYATSNSGAAGGGGGQASGGAGGSGNGGQTGTKGSGANAGHHAGGGGGGGWYGGGSGGAGPTDGGGGGGSSFTGGLTNASTIPGSGTSCANTGDEDYIAGTCAPNQNGAAILKW